MLLLKLRYTMPQEQSKDDTSHHPPTRNKTEDSRGPMNQNRTSESNRTVRRLWNQELKNIQSIRIERERETKIKTYLSFAHGHLSQPYWTSSKNHHPSHYVVHIQVRVSSKLPRTMAVREMALLALVLGEFNIYWHYCASITRCQRSNECRCDGRVEVQRNVKDVE